MSEQDPQQGTSGETAFEVRGEYITLGQLLKMIGAIGTGGEAKYYLSANPILVNDDSEQRRGRKLRSGDLIVIPGEAPIRIVPLVREEAS